MKNIDIESLDIVSKENVLKLKEYQEQHNVIEKEQEKEIRSVEKKYFSEFKKNWTDQREFIEKIPNFYLQAFLNSNLKSVIKDYDKPLLEKLK